MFTRTAKLAGACVGALAAVTAGFRVFASTLGPAPRRFIDEPVPPGLAEHQSSPGPGLPPGTWVVAEGSMVGFRGVEVIGGKRVEAAGRAAAVSGELVWDGQAWTGIRVAADLRAVTTGNERRDQFFHRTAGLTHEHPHAEFHSTMSAASGGVRGLLTLHGRSLEVRAAVRTSVSETRPGAREVVVDGIAPVRYPDWGIPTPNLGWVAVDPRGWVEFHLVLIRKDA